MTPEPTSPPTPVAPTDPAWHAAPATEALAHLGVAPGQGLSEDEAAARLRTHGPNSLPPPRRLPAWRRFLRQFDNVLIYVLLVAALVTALLGQWVDSAVILGVTVINALIGYLQEGKAEEALGAIRHLLAPQAQVLRAGRRREVDATTLVPGDLVLLASGDRVPADLRLVEARNLRVDESTLTGESVPVEKDIAPVAAGAALGDRRGMAFSGTLVTYGQASGVVVATGAATEIGRISRLLSDVTTLATPLLRQLQGFAQTLTWVVVLLAVGTFALGYLWRDYSAAEMFFAAVALTVSVIPEGLPAFVTITLALGVQRMARRRALVRRLPAVEALGAVTVICTDKTGTLTRNEMTVRQVVTAEDVLAVTGVGYAPHGGIERDGHVLETAAAPLLATLGRAALLCNDASLHAHEGQWQLTGDPTEGALLSFALKTGLDEAFEREAWPRTDAIPFESEHRFMATLHHDHDGHALVFLKGAPERVLALCTQQRRADGHDEALDAAHWHARQEAAASEGLRLLALAVRAAPADQRTLAFADAEAGGFTLLALLGMEDPPREEAIAAVAACRAAGIRVKMITGDHVVTARAIGEQLGLSDEVRAVSGHALDGMSEAELDAAAREAAIFARASPEHKLRLVQALQRQGEVVAMTGDGVNDAPALKQADVGVAMGQKGTEAAREASEIVLADDNFASIAAAVEEGRTVYDNIRKSIVFVLPTNGGQAGLLLIAILLGLTLPITPVQILWINMVTTVTLALVLAFEAPEADLMARPPRRSGAPLLEGFLVWRIVFVTLLMVAGSLGIFLWELERGVPLEVARTAAVNAIVVAELAYLLNVRRFTAPALTRAGLGGNRYVPLAAGVLVLLQTGFTYWPAMQRLFGTAALDAETWARLLALGLVVLLVVEAEKALLARWRRRASALPS